ncbi:hypothetical protein CVT24_004964 [Panaeolus cyanescens]|uniref:F-box domain-containing protein n=1 Tax=Panaeolus cyanescens TaxID=181874 RepID=A0A409YB34_9AGAR|nr:hypothetical protein CVT24_004964 [Panaeolus cyanescens]
MSHWTGFRDEEDSTQTIPPYDPPAYEFTDQDLTYVFDTTNWVDPVSSLPLDVVSLIFCFACKAEISTNDGDWRRKFHPLHLGRVSRAWRHTAWQTSELWETLILRLDRVTSFPTFSEILFEWLQRTSGRPLDIFISIPKRKRSRSAIRTFEPVIDTLMEYSAQWRTVNLKMLHKAYNFFSDPASPSSSPFAHLSLPLLQSLTIQSAYGVFPTSIIQVPEHGVSPVLDFAVALNLQELCFKGIHIPDELSSLVHVSKHQIKRLSFYRCPTVKITHVLKQFPALEHLTVSSLDSRFNWQYTDVITHPRLKSVVSILSKHDRNSHGFFSPFLDLPALESVSVFTDYPQRYSVMFQLFLEASTSTRLTHLHLESTAFIESEIIFTLEMMPSLTHLSIHLKHYPIAECNDESALSQIFFEQLNPDQSGSYLPRLEEFEYEGYLSVSAIDFLEPLILRSRIRSTNSEDVNATAVLRRVRIKAHQICDTCEVIISEYSDPQYIWEIMMMMDMNVLTLLDEDGNRWE